MKEVELYRSLDDGHLYEPQHTDGFDPSYYEKVMVNDPVILTPAQLTESDDLMTILITAGQARY